MQAFINRVFPLRCYSNCRVRLYATAFVLLLLLLLVLGATPTATMTSQRSTTLAVLGLLAGFVNVDAFRMAPATPRVVSSSLAREQTSAVRREASTRSSRTWQTARGLKMSSASAVGSDVSATEELDDTPSRASVMDELDAILGDVQLVRRD